MLYTSFHSDQKLRQFVIHFVWPYRNRALYGHITNQQIRKEIVSSEMLAFLKEHQASFNKIYRRFSEIHYDQLHSVSNTNDHNIVQKVTLRMARQNLIAFATEYELISRMITEEDLDKLITKVIGEEYDIISYIDFVLIFVLWASKRYHGDRNGDELGLKQKLRNLLFEIDSEGEIFDLRSVALKTLY